MPFPRKSVFGKRIAALVVAAVVAIGASALGHPPAAHAGSNGQQIQLCTSVLTYSGTAFIVGQNQNGLVTAGPTIPLTVPGRCTPLHGWWWKGTVTIHWYYAGGSYYRSSTCRIKTVQYGSDWAECVAPNGETGPFDSTHDG